MLKTIDPLLGPDLLHVLASMGHGDELVLCDANFPAQSVARSTNSGQLIRLDHVTTTRAAKAILSLLPLDTFVDTPAMRMEIVGAPDEIPLVQVEMQSEIKAADPQTPMMGALERHAFYERAKSAYAVVATGERRFYGCFLFTKGVIPPEADI